MSALDQLRKLTMKMACERMLETALKKKGLSEDQLEEQLKILTAPVRKFAESLPQDEAGALILYKEYIGEAWEGLSKNPIILNLALAHRTSLIAPKMKGMFEDVKAWIDDPEFTEEHFNLLFGL